MQDLRVCTNQGVILDGVLYDHPALQEHLRASRRMSGYPSCIVRVQLHHHASIGARLHVTSLVGALICMAEPVRVTDPSRQQVTHRPRLVA